MEGTENQGSDEPAESSDTGSQAGDADKTEPQADAAGEAKDADTSEAEAQTETNEHVEDESLAKDDSKPEAEAKEQGDESAEDGNPAQEQAPPAMPAFDGEATVGDVTVRVHADEGAFPAGVRLEASYADVEDAKQATIDATDTLADENADAVESIALDVRVVNAEGAEVEPAEGATVGVSFQTGRVAEEATDVSVFHVQDDGAIEELKTVKIGSIVSAATASFSTYVVKFAWIFNDE